jgi:hypothetical protein
MPHCRSRTNVQLSVIRRTATGIFALICVVAATIALAAPAGAVVVGIGDGNPGVFSDPRFLALHIHEARITVPWDMAITRSSKQRRLMANWLKAAKKAQVTPLVSFAGDGNYIPSLPVYTHAVRAFMRDFPSVKRYTPWNEPDWIYRNLSREPGLAAAYFNTLVRNCRGCLIIAGDVYLPGPQLGSWLRAYIRGLHYRPSAWALHNYDDVRTHKTGQLRTMLRMTSGQIWLDEISGVERRGHWPYPNQSAARAKADEQFLFSLPQRFPRVSRIYHYEWQGVATAGWDSGLIAPNGRIRPAYYVVKAAAD